MPGQQLDLDKKIIERGYWIATHRLFISKWITISLYTVIGIVYIIFFVQFGLYMYRLNEWPEHISRSVQPYFNWEQLQAAAAPLDLEFGTALVFPLGVNKYDFIVEVHNPNKAWALESISYDFTFGADGHTGEHHAFLVPGETKFLTVLAYESDTPIDKADFTAFNYRWKKEVRLPELSWITTDPPAYSPKQIIVEGTAQNTLPAHVSWGVKNGSTLNIRTVLWQIALYNGGQLVSVLEYETGNFTFLQERTFDVTVRDLPSPVDNVTVYPIVNVFDPNFSYLR